MAKTNQSEETVEEEDTESDESSEEATEEESDDSGSESDDEESSDDESEEEGEKEEGAEQLLNPAKLPKELQPLGKKMQASLTKAIQRYKKAYEDRTDELSTRYARAIKAESALSVLSEQEAFKMYLADARENRPYGYSSVYNRGTTNKEEDNSSSNGDEKLSSAKLERMIQAAVVRAIEPFAKSQASMTRAQLEKNLPNFNRYRAEIEELVQTEGLSVERAYLAASEKDRMAEAIEAAVKQGKKDIKRIPRTEGKSAAGSRGLTMKPAKTLREALNFASSQVE